MEFKRLCSLMVHDICLVCRSLYQMSVNECHSHTEIHHLFSYHLFKHHLFTFSLYRSADHWGLPTFSHQNLTFNAKCSVRIWNFTLATMLSGISAKFSVKLLGHLTHMILSFHFCIQLLSCWCETEVSLVQTLITYTLPPEKISKKYKQV